MVSAMNSYLDDANTASDVSARFNKMSEAWITAGGDAIVGTSALDASPYLASSTPLHTPETPNLDHPLFPSVGDFACLDGPFADYSPPYTSGEVAPAVHALGVHPFGNRASFAMSDGYDLNCGSTTSPGALYAQPSSRGGMWPTHVSPTAYLPTPPVMDDLTAEDSVEEEILAEATKKRKRATVASAGVTKRTASNASSAKSSDATGTNKPKRSQTQLRTASRAPKKRTPNTLHKPAESVEEVKARAAHNQVEQQYRKRLNAHFEKLLAVLPPPEDSSEGGARDGIGDRRVSKAEVLDMARQRIRELERQTAALERERRELRGRIGGYEGQWPGKRGL